MEYGLIGETLSHSFSKVLHEQYLNTNYELVSLNKEELKDFFLKKDFKGINVTIPYKKEVIQYLDYIDPLVKEINACKSLSLYFSAYSLYKQFSSNASANSSPFSFPYALPKNSSFA